MILLLLEYCDITWHGCSKENQKKIERLQKRAGRNVLTADFSAVYRPGFLKHDSPVHDSPVVIRLRGYHSSANFVNDEILSVNIRLFSTKFKVKTSVAFI